MKYQYQSSKNLYSQNFFKLPQLNQQPIFNNPFHTHTIKSTYVNKSSKKYINNASSTYQLTNSLLFQTIVGKQNLYPLYLSINTQFECLIICAKECMIICKLQCFRKDNIESPQWIKISLEDIPISISSGQRFIYLAYQNGCIIEYDLHKIFSNLTNIVIAPNIFQQVCNNINQIQVIKQQGLQIQLLAIDNVGNLNIIILNRKIFMDRVIKVSSKLKPIKINSQIKIIKKRQKIKNLFNNFISKDPKTNNIKDNNTSIQNYHIKFCILPQSYSKPNLITVAYFYLGSNIQNQHKQEKDQNNNEEKKSLYNLSILSYDDQSLQIVDQKILLSGLTQTGLLCFGLGGFQSGNSTFLLLVVCLKNQIYYYRAVDVQGCFQWHLVSSVSAPHECIFHMEFISNNMLLYLSSNYIMISNVNESNLEIIHNFDIKKFSYIDFFNTQEEFNFQFNKKNIYSSLLKIDNRSKSNNQLCSKQFYLLQGKRLLLGKILSWKDYLNIYIQKGQWEQAMQIALQIYQGKLSKLAGINQKMEIRKNQMQNFFQKITLTFLAYKIRNKFNNYYQKQIQALKGQIQDSQNIKTQETTEKISQKQQKQQRQQKQQQKQEKQIQQTSKKQEQIQKRQEQKEVKDKIQQKQAQSKAQQKLSIIFVNPITESICQELKKTKRSLENDEQVKEIIGQAIEFMVNTQSQCYLFTTIYQAIKDLKLQTIFYQHLWNYVENGSIIFMSEQVLIKTIAHYKQISKMQVIDALFMGFDLKFMEKSLILSLCLSQGLYESLIHISTQQKDFITPIIKLCGIALQKDRIINNDRIEQIIFYYLRECLQGRRTQYGNNEQFLQMLQQMLSFLFIPSSIQMLIQISVMKLLETVDIFFQPKILQAILENQGLKIQMRVSFQKIFQENAIRQYQVYQNILTTLIFSLNKFSQKYQSNSIYCDCHHQYVYQLWKFLTYTLLKNQLPFKIQYKIKSVSFFIGHPQMFQKGINDVEELIINGHLMRLMDSSIRSLANFELKQQINSGNTFSLNSLIISERQINQQNIQQPKKQQISKQSLLRSYLSQIELSQSRNLLSQSICYLYHQLEEPGKVVITFLKTKNQILRYRIFQYLQHNLHQIDIYRTQQSYNQLAIQVIRNVESLIKLNSKKLLIFQQKLLSLDLDKAKIQLRNQISIPIYNQNILKKQYSISRESRQKFHQIELSKIQQFSIYKLSQKTLFKNSNIIFKILTTLQNKLTKYVMKLKINQVWHTFLLKAVEIYKEYLFQLIYFYKNVIKFLKHQLKKIKIFQIQ